MLKTVLTRFIGPLRAGNQKILLSNPRFLASFRNRDFQWESSDGESSSNLITRFARHITIKNACSKDPIKYTIRYADYYPVSDGHRFLRDLREVPIEQLPQMIVFTSIYKGRTEIPILVGVVNGLDNECAKKVDQMSQQQIIEMFNSFMYFLPHKLVQLDFYQLAIRKLIDGFSEENSVTEFVEVCFYLGMWKKNRVAMDYMNHLIKSYLSDHINQLETLDLAIICNAAYKTSTRINNKTFLDRLVSEILSMDEPDVPLLITFLKSCRHNRVKSTETLEKVMTWIKDGQFDGTDIVAHAHILAYLAENRVSDHMNVSKLVTQGAKKVNSTTRGKDISTLLWSCAHLGYDFSDETTMNRIANIVYGKLDDGEYRYASDVLVDTCLSMWMLGYKSKEMADAALQDMIGLRKNDQRVKLDSRRILLKTCVDLERGDHRGDAFKEDRQAPDYLISNRMGLQTTFKTLENIKEEFNLKSVDYVQQVNELNIAGICVGTKSGERFHVEVFDETNTLSDNKSPFGLMKLKQKILKQRECDVVRVNISGVSDQEEIDRIVKEEINRFLVSDPNASDDEKGVTEPVSVKT